MSYPEVSADEIFRAVETFYRALLLPAALHLEVDQEDGARPRGAEAAPVRGAAVPRRDVEAPPDRRRGGTLGPLPGELTCIALVPRRARLLGVASAYQLFQLVAARRFLRRVAPARRPARHLPPVTVLKPLKGPGVELDANLESFCRQDYPTYQIVFGVEDAGDPAVEIVAVRSCAGFPTATSPSRSGTRTGANRKVASLVPHDAARPARRAGA